MSEAIELLPCPFCGLDLTRGSRRINPNARCTTEECYGAKMPVVNLDVPDSVNAWNRRAALPLLRAGDREEIARVIDPKAWTEVECAPEDKAIWALSRQKDRDAAFAKADAILSLPAMQGEASDNERLRRALIATGNAVGATLSDQVTTDFVMGVPREVELAVARLRNEAATLPVVQGEWRDISTAPEVLNAVDLWVVHSANGGRREADGSRNSLGDWHDRGGNLLNWNYEEDDGTITTSRVTHWMPLPAPPVAKE